MNIHDITVSQCIVECTRSRTGLWSWIEYFQKGDGYVESYSRTGGEDKPQPRFHQFFKGWWHKLYVGYSTCSFAYFFNSSVSESTTLLNDDHLIVTIQDIEYRVVVFAIICLILPCIDSASRTVLALFMSILQLSSNSYPSTCGDILN